MTTHELIERLNLHRSWRDSHGELNDAPHKAAQALSTLTNEVARLRRRLAEFGCTEVENVDEHIATLTKGEGTER